MRIYLDSSALVKKFSKEEGSEIIEEIFKKCEGGKLVLVVSQWTINECITAFDKSFKRGDIDGYQMNSDIIDLVSLIENLRRKGCVEIVPIYDDTITQSVGFIRFNHLSADDSLHALCAMLGSSNMLLMHDN